MDTGHLSPSSNGTMQTTYLQTTLPPHTPTCFYCSRRGSLRCLSPSFVCDGEYDCSDRSDERNCTRDGIQRSVVMNGVVVGLLVLFVIAVVGAIVVALLRTFVVLYHHRADRSREKATCPPNRRFVGTVVMSRTVSVRHTPSIAHERNLIYTIVATQSLAHD
ncbi:hypothetical protein LSAT2_001448 [Lamellibrachia satsuma]|nr:hypothetical protein LSAT2_001448 [Lamellibrachia satsuma]